MNNLNNMLKNGNIPDEMKEKLNGFLNQNSSTTNSTNHTNTSESCDSNQESQNTSNNMNPEMLQNLMKMFSGMNQNGTDNVHNSSNETSSSEANPFNNIDIGTILKLKGVMEKMQNTKDDPRSNLLLSLKPYLKDSRKSKVEQYIQLFHMTKIFESFNENGGEHTK